MIETFKVKFYIIRKKVDVVLLLKNRYCAANETRRSYIIIYEISRNSIITLLCAAKEAYLEQTTLNHY